MRYRLEVSAGFWEFESADEMKTKVTALLSLPLTFTEITVKMLQSTSVVKLGCPKKVK